MKIRIFIVFLLVVIISVLDLKSGSKSVDLSKYNDYEKGMNFADVSSVTDTVFDNAEQKKEYSENIDGCVGYIEIPETIIKLPVMQGKDNEYYLKHNIDGNYDRCGSLFLDYRANNESSNKVIYGHNMGSGRTEMFSKLVDFQNKNYAEKHRYLNWNDKNGGNNVYKLCAIMNFDINKLSEFDYMKPEFTSEEFNDFKQYVNRNSMFVLDSIEYSDKLITLSTCNRAYGTDNRLIIIFKLIL